ncbi:alpha/beta fold hydrolase [Pseudomonas sp. R1-43-08]|uniref:alpha/beta fold hydrolase n=1 Tax=Pseudomonas sp. R1-43-08 TaxID=1173270 RepID=UPI002114F59C|nr:alpha/beta fold hydrolase [Pseudomonas sp. R1-43-08]
MRVLLLLAALLFGLPSFAASRCDVNVPTQTVDLAQVSIAYQSIGRASDPALLLVMGLGGQLIHWPDEVVVALCQQGFRVIRYDNRDVGLSTWRQAPASANLTFEVLRYKLGLPVAAPYTLTDMADDALGLMDALQVRQFHVLGASMGGMIAQHLAAMAPQRVESLTLIMTSSGAEGLPARMRHWCSCCRGAARLIVRWRWNSRRICLRHWAARMCRMIARHCCIRRRCPMTVRSTPKA